MRMYFMRFNWLKSCEFGLHCESSYESSYVFMFFLFLTGTRDGNASHSHALGPGKVRASSTSCVEERRRGGHMHACMREQTKTKELSEQEWQEFTQICRKIKPQDDGIIDILAVFDG